MQIAFDKKLIRFASGCLLLIGIGGLIALAAGLSPPFAWVACLAAAAVVITGICLLQVYHAQRLILTEQEKLKESLINDIFAQYNELPPKKFVEAYLDKRLAKQSSAQRRWHLLNELHHKADSRDFLIEELRQQHIDYEVLEDLGLSWEKKSRRKHKA